MTGKGRTAGIKTSPIAFVHLEFHNDRDDSLLFVRPEDTTTVLIKIKVCCCNKTKFNSFNSCWRTGGLFKIYLPKHICFHHLMSRQMTAAAEARQILKPSINHIEDVDAIYLLATCVKY